MMNRVKVITPDLKANNFQGEGQALGSVGRIYPIKNLKSTIMGVRTVHALLRQT
jgi:hypothetical protein